MPSVITAVKMRQTDGILRSAAHGQSGAFDRDVAGAVVETDPTKFRLVPPSQYRTTD